MQKIKVLFISHSSEIHGAEKTLLTLVERLDKQKFEPAVVFPEEGLLKNYIAELGVKTYLSPLDRWIRYGGEKDPENANIYERIEYLSEIVLKEAPDIIHTNTSVIWEGALAAKLNGIAHVWHVHETLGPSSSLRPLLPVRCIYEFIDDNSERIITVSEATKLSLARYISAKRVSVIYNGIDGERFRGAVPAASLRSTINCDDNTFLIATIASFIHEKGIDILLDAAKLIKGCTSRIRFLVIGQIDEQAAQKLISQILALDLETSVYHLGFRHDIPDILSQIDLLVVSSRVESFSIAVIEAMAAGKPVLSTRCGGPEELIVDGETGYLVAAEDSVALGGKILAIYKRKTELAELGRAARERFEQHFEADYFVKRIQNVYLEALAEPSATSCSEREREMLFDLMSNYNLNLARTEDARRDARIQELENQVQALKASNSWEITAPLRFLRRLTSFRK